MLQPAEIFLDRSGEEIRRRTFTLTDPSGRDLALRPDLTIPICKRRGAVGAESCPRASAIMAWSSAISQASRIAPPNSSRRERSCSGLQDRAAGETEILSLAIEALRAAGLKDFSLRIRRPRPVRRAGGCAGAAPAVALTPEAAFLARGLCRKPAPLAGPWRRRAQAAGDARGHRGAVGPQELTRR